RTPRCVSPLARATTPCGMHSHPSHRASSVDSPAAQYVAAPMNPGACHTDQGPGCLSGGACPAASPAAVALSSSVLGLTAPDGPVSRDRVHAYPPSFAPPPPPPPQA